MGELARIIVGTGQVGMRPGPDIYADIDNLIERTAGSEQRIPANKRIVTKDLRSCHATQRKHFENCITPSPNATTTVCDRFGRKILCRGSGKNENGWRQIRAIFPEVITVDSGINLTLASIAGWNFNRELQYDPRWAYLPFSPMDIILTQYIALMPSEYFIITTERSISSIFHALPLSLDDCSECFGLTPAFAEARTTLPTIDDPELSAVVMSITDNAIWCSNTYDPLVSDCLGAAAGFLADPIRRDNDASESALSHHTRSISFGNAEYEDFPNVIQNEQVNNDDLERNSEIIFEGGMVPHAGQAIRSNRKRRRSVGSISHVRNSGASHKKTGVSQRDG